MNIIKGKIIKIEKIEKVDLVYDITVADNHNLFVNNILTSNCHHIAADTFLQVSKNAINAYYRIGVSATPWREDGADLLIEASLDRKNEKHNISASYLINKGYLVPCNIYMINIPEIFQGKSYDKLYKAAIVNNNKRNFIACKIALKMREVNDSTILMLIQQVQHGRNIFKALGEALERRGVLKKTGTKDILDKDKCVIDTLPIYDGTRINVIDPMNGKQQLVKVCYLELLTGEDSPLRRAAVIEGVKKGIVKILIGSTIADEGLDIPNLDCLILLSAGKSSTKAFQRIGRVLRNYEEKDKNGNIVYKKQKAIVFDFIDNTPMLLRHSKRRMKMYRSEPAWHITEFNLDLLK